jgi:hypothetical protein
MHATRLKDTGHVLVRLRLHKGVLVVLTNDEYIRGLARGKAERRAARRQASLAHRQAVQEGQTLAWIPDATKEV